MCHLAAMPPVLAVHLHCQCYNALISRGCIQSDRSLQKKISKIIILVVSDFLQLPSVVHLKKTPFHDHPLSNVET